jgi:hypothetical protein
MRTKLGNWTGLAVVVVAMVGTQSGCKTGWKMPGSDMFPWSKKPSESTLAGSSPSMSVPNSANSPIGPAYKNSPSALASGPAKSMSPYGSPNSTGPSFNMPQTNAMASSMPNGAGVSAGANGYSTGPYGMASNSGRSGYTPTSGYGAPTPQPNGYGSPAPVNALAGQSGMPPAYGGMPTGMPTGMPNGPVQSPSISSYAPMGGVAALPAGYNPGAVNSVPSQSSMPNALPNGYQQSNPSGGPPVQTYAGAAPYRPGSVGRQTSYDFSNQGGGSGLPPAGVPGMANQLPNGLPNSMNR